MSASFRCAARRWACLALGLVLAGGASAQASLDPDFGEQGLVRLAPHPDWGPYPDGAIGWLDEGEVASLYLLGWVGNPGQGSQVAFAVAARLNDRGELDTGFAGSEFGGMVYAPCLTQGSMADGGVFTTRRLAASPSHAPPELWGGGRLLDFNGAGWFAGLSGVSAGGVQCHAAGDAYPDALPEGGLRALAARPAQVPLTWLSQSGADQIRWGQTAAPYGALGTLSGSVRAAHTLGFGLLLLHDDGMPMAQRRFRLQALNASMVPVTFGSLQSPVGMALFDEAFVDQAELDLAPSGQILAVGRQGAACCCSASMPPATFGAASRAKAFGSTCRPGPI